MDLIYADGNINDLGVLQDYSLDMEYGADSTDDFEVKVQKYNHVCDQDYILYIEFTEYGGVIDRIESATKSGEVTYKGRTWHGLLNSFVIEPPTGHIYRTFNGDANVILAEIVTLCGLNDLFVIDNTVSGINIAGFQSRYEKAYDLILRMFSEYNAKMYCYWKGGHVYIGALLAMNYAVSEEFDSSQVPFKVGLTYNNINHMVCLGQGVGVDRAVIHLFCDEGGGVQPYTLIDNPLQDSDYILDKRNQVLFGREERTEIFDEPNAEIITNYLPLTQEPSDWAGTYFNYFVPNVNASGELEYNNVERKYEDVYYLQTTCPPDWYLQNGYQKYYKWDETSDSWKNVEELPESQQNVRYEVCPSVPDDWANCWSKYYEYDSSSQTYNKVSDEYDITYKRLDECPPDWEWRYSSYYYREQSGTGWVYKHVEGITDYKWDKHTSKPSNWEESWGSYYTKLKAGQYKSGKKVVKYKAGYYTVDYAVNTAKVIPKQKGKSYPKWEKGKFYTRVSVTSAPPWLTIGIGGWWEEVKSAPHAPAYEQGRYYDRFVDSTPAWTAGTYYTLVNGVEQIPTFLTGTYYYVVQDRLAMLIQDAAKRWSSLRDTSTLDIDLELESNYDVGDVVGSIDEVTKIEVNKMIKRKIIKIRKDIVSVEYNVD